MAATRIALIGQPYWTGHLAGLLNRYGGGRVDASAIPLRSLGSWRVVSALRNVDVLFRVGFRPGSPTPRGTVFDLLWEGIRAAAPRARVVYYWIGTDVLQCLADARAGRLRRGPWRRATTARHLAGAPWLADELKEAGIEARPCLVPSASSWTGPVPPLPDRVRVLSYIPDARHAYYGGEAIYRAAEALPSIAFSVVGGTGSWVPSPLTNLEFHGWQRDLGPHYAAATVVARLVPHDALGGTVREAMWLGRHVVYTYPIPFTHPVAFDDPEGLIGTIARLHDAHLSGSLRVNDRAAEYARTEFDESRTASALIRELLEDG